MPMLRVKRALLSVWDKTGLVEFAKGLRSLRIELISTGGTAEALRSADIPCRLVEEVIDFPELLDGRVKTLHSRIHAGILARRDDDSQMRQLALHQIEPIDLVVVNLYPFEETVRAGVKTVGEALEQIDIGGVALLRAAGKNYPWVGAVARIEAYQPVLQELQRNLGCLSEATIARLTAEAFAATARYDQAIHVFMGHTLAQPASAGPGVPGTNEPGPVDLSTIPSQAVVSLKKIQDLRYGENPHQRGAWYAPGQGAAWGMAQLTQRQGKALSYNNLMDVDAALRLVCEFTEPAAAIIKHGSPCGAATGSTLEEAYARALEADRMSAFGGVVGLNRPLDQAAALAIAGSDFIEAVVAPGLSETVLGILANKKHLRVMAVPPLRTEDGRLVAHPTGVVPMELRSISGAWLLQTADIQPMDRQAWKVATQAQPTPEQLEALCFAWKVVKHIRSNAIVLVKGRQTVGLAGGLPSRVDAVRWSIAKAGLQARGAVLASDAFFPKADNIEAAAQAGIVAVVQPGGSIRDQDVIEAANRAGLAMVVTGVRHFKH